MKDKIMLVTGGSSGLGLATTQLFLREGAQVIVAARSREKFRKNLDEHHPDLHFIETDFSEMESVRNLYKKIEAEFPGLDFALNNVGGGSFNAIPAIEEEAYDYVMNLNLKSLWLGMKYQIPLMQKDSASQKHIINVSSINGLGGVPTFSTYAAAKAGVISFTKSAAMELAQSHISVNCIVPGAFDTPMLEEVMSRQSGGDPEKKAGIENSFKASIPQGRFGDPAEFAETVLWLCQSKARYISGQALVIDGGETNRYH